MKLQQEIRFFFEFYKRDYSGKRTQGPTSQSSSCFTTYTIGLLKYLPFRWPIPCNWESQPSRASSHRNQAGSGSAPSSGLRTCAAASGACLFWPLICFRRSDMFFSASVTSECFSQGPPRLFLLFEWHGSFRHFVPISQISLFGRGPSICGMF